MNKSEKYVELCKCLLGHMQIYHEEDFIVGLKLGTKDINVKQKSTTLSKEAIKQINQYLSKNRNNFNLPIKLNGTQFQEKVWSEIIKIPYGETRSYKDIAIQINNSKAFRAVGMANNQNKIPLLIPCHRVIGINGSLVGYSLGIKVKQTLLDIEKS